MQQNRSEGCHGRREARRCSRLSGTGGPAEPLRRPDMSAGRGSLIRLLCIAALRSTAPETCHEHAPSFVRAMVTAGATHRPSPGAAVLYGLRVGAAPDHRPGNGEADTSAARGGTAGGCRRDLPGPRWPGARLPRLPRRGHPRGHGGGLRARDREPWRLVRAGGRRAAEARLRRLPPRPARLGPQPREPGLRLRRCGQRRRALERRRGVPGRSSPAAIAAWRWWGSPGAASSPWRRA